MASLQTSLQTLIRTPMLDASGLITREWTLFMQQLIKSLNVTDDLQAQIGYILDPAGLPVVHSLAYQTSAQNITINTPTMLTFDTNAYDVGAVHSTSVNPTRFTAPVAGTYLVQGQWQLGSNGNGALQMQVYKNGAAPTPLILTQDFQNNSIFFAQQIVGVIQLAVNDYIEFRASEGVATTTTTASGVWGSLTLLSQP
jgi:hypothetical protein